MIFLRSIATRHTGLALAALIGLLAPQGAAARTQDASPPATSTPPTESGAEPGQGRQDVLTPGPLSPADMPELMIDPNEVVPDAQAPVITLEQLVARASEVDGNLDIQVLRERFAQANLNVSRAWTALLPTVQAVGGYTRNSIAAQIAFPDFSKPAQVLTNPDGTVNIIPQVVNATLQPVNQWTAQIALSQPILVMPAYFGIANARTASELTEKQVTFARNEIILGISQAYYGAVAARRLIEVSAAQLESAKEQERVAKARFDVGEIPKVGYLRAAVQRATFEQDLRRAQNAYMSTKIALAALVGIEGPFSVEAPPEAEIPRGTRDELIRVALENRQDLQANRLALEVAERAVKTAWWQFAPVLAATGQLNFTNFGGFTGDATTWTVGVTAILNIFDAGNTVLDIRQTRIQVRESAFNLENNARNVKRDVETALVDLESAQANLIKAQEQSRLAAESAQLVRAQFDAGAATYLDVVDANSTTFGSRVLEVTEALNVQTAALRLQRAIGSFGVQNLYD